MPAATSRTRILHVIQNLNYGGMERLLADIVRGVHADRFESHVLVLQYLGRFAEGLDAVATLHQAAPMSRWSLLRPQSLIEQMRAIKPDVMHSHSGVWYKASGAARAAGVPRVIHTEHGRQTPDPWIARFIDGRAAARTDVAVAVSEAVARQLETRVVRGRCPVEVVLNGVDTELYKPLPDTGRLRSELGVAPQTPIIGSIGRLEPIKGYDVMVEAFARLSADPSLLTKPLLVIAGDGSESTSLKTRITQLGLQDQIRLLGWRDDVHDLLSAYDLFTMSSRSEGTSVSLLEAMSFGLCPVVTDVGGNRAVLGPALAHRLVPSEQPAALAEAWRDVLRDVERRQADQCLARERVREAYSARTMVAAYERLYRAD